MGLADPSNNNSGSNNRMYYQEHMYKKKEEKTLHQTFFFKPFGDHAVDFSTSSATAFDISRNILNAAIKAQGLWGVYVPDDYIEAVNASRVDGEESRVRKFIHFPKLEGAHNIGKWIADLPESVRGFSSGKYPFNPNKKINLMFGFATEQVNGDGTNKTINNMVSRVMSGNLPFIDTPVYLAFDETTAKNLNEQLEAFCLNNGIESQHEIDWRETVIVFTRIATEIGTNKGNVGNSFRTNILKMPSEKIPNYPETFDPSTGEWENPFAIEDSEKGILEHWKRIPHLFNAPYGVTLDEERIHQIEAAVWGLGIYDLPDWASEYEFKVPEGVEIVYHSSVPTDETEDEE